ncbi:MAG: hypothetical protein ABEJ85_00775 [Haloarculaceae archaeon]
MASITAANVNKKEVKMWIGWFLAWGVLGWAFNTGYFIKQLTPETGAPAAVLGVPVNLLFLWGIGAATVLIPAYYTGKLDLDRGEPETERVYTARIAPGANEEE